MSCFADGLNTLTDPLNMGKNSLLALVSILGSFWQISLGKLLCNFLFNCFPMYLLYWPDNKLCINYLGCDEVITDRSGQLTTLADTGAKYLVSSLVPSKREKNILVLLSLYIF